MINNEIPQFSNENKSEITKEHFCIINKNKTHR